MCELKGINIWNPKISLRKYGNNVENLPNLFEMMQ